VPCTVLGTFMARMRGAIVVHFKNRRIGETSTQACADFVKSWTHQQPLKSKVHRPQQRPAEGDDSRKPPEAIH